VDFEVTGVTAGGRWGNARSRCRFRAGGCAAARSRWTEGL